KGKRLRPDDLVATICNFARTPEPGAEGLELRATKDSYLTGVQLFVRLIPGNSTAVSQGWSNTQRVTLGREGLHGSSGSGTKDTYSEIEYWNDLKEAVKKALAGAPETPFEIRVKLSPGK